MIGLVSTLFRSLSQGSHPVFSTSSLVALILSLTLYMHLHHYALFSTLIVKEREILCLSYFLSLYIPLSSSCGSSFSHLQPLTFVFIVSITRGF